MKPVLIDLPSLLSNGRKRQILRGLLQRREGMEAHMLIKI